MAFLAVTTIFLESYVITYYTPYFKFISSWLEIQGLVYYNGLYRVKMEFHIDVVQAEGEVIGPLILVKPTDKTYVLRYMH